MRYSIPDAELTSMIDDSYDLVVKGLKKAASIIKLSLIQNDLVKARKELQALVSRDTAQLDKKPSTISWLGDRKMRFEFK